jgi:hypothetical protein
VGIRLQQATERCIESFPILKEMVLSLRAGGVSEAPDKDTRFQCRCHLFEEFGRELPEDWCPPEGPDSEYIQFIGTLAEHSFGAYTCTAMAFGIYDRMGLCISFVHFRGTERSRGYVRSHRRMPRGHGQYLMTNNVVSEYFCCAVTSLDVRRFSVKIGEPGHTTLWGLLALLLAARLWLANSRRFLAIQVRSDSLGALRVAVKLASRSANLNFIAQELALHMAAHDFEFKLLQHIPGIIANDVPDVLSRQFAMPPKVCPSSCATAVNRSVPERTASFWRTAQ